MSQQPSALKLLKPFALGPYHLANRMVMAPMSRNRADAEDAPTALAALYYRQRASAGLIVTEASPIAPGARAGFRAPGIYTSAQIDGWRRICEAVHAEAGRIFLQLWHAGRISHPSLQPDDGLPVAPSAIAPAGTLNTGRETVPFVAPRVLGRDEIKTVTEGFALAAAKARQAGFDGVEVHAANGYLIDQFLRDGSNQRTDEYGGAFANRIRFLEEILEAVEPIWPRHCVTVRLSPTSPYNSMSDTQPQALFEYAAAALSERGIAALHMDETPSVPFDWRSLRRRFRGVYIANAGYDRERAEAAIASGHADLVSFGVPFLANPDLVARFRLGAALNPADRSTFYGGGERGYTDYPQLRPSP